uniref:Cytosol aminopeptidase n=2 Tax=Nilaparvata lugens TaxID=108931 RepID=A0A1I9WLH2_NILLU|nr:seminal fluid protein [Nilaparvata lugens]
MKSFGIRNFSAKSPPEKKGLLLGAYTGDKDGEIVFTKAAQGIDNECQGKLAQHIEVAGPGLKQGKCRVFYKLHQNHDIIAIVGLGKQNLTYNEMEDVDEKREAVRIAACNGCRTLQDVGVTHIYMENLGEPQCAAEGANLGLWLYQENRSPENQVFIPQVLPFEGPSEGWKKGEILAEAQNLARRLQDTPANLMTPTIFAENAAAILDEVGVVVVVHDKAWAEKKKMGSFLSVAAGSEEPPLFLEITYNGGKPSDKPIALVGKGITFDTGGISLKPAGSMADMRGDMGGAACIVGALTAIARLQLPVNIVALIPLTENMPSGKATKPGDVVTAMNGKTICVDNTDAEGRLVLADALLYAATFNPVLTVDLATLTGAIIVCLGSAASGVFTNSTPMWKVLHKAGTVTGDRVWRLPIYKDYTNLMTYYRSVDINNIGKDKVAGSCKAAAFLMEFAPKENWIHMDIAGVLGPSDYHPYLHKGMMGRPTRTLVEFVERLPGSEGFPS